MLFEHIYRWYHQYCSAMYEALYSCGGSTAIESNLEYYDQRSYLMVGRCNAGLRKGISAANGLEKKHDTRYLSLELQFGTQHEGLSQFRWSFY